MFINKLGYYSLITYTPKNLRPYRLEVHRLRPLRLKSHRLKLYRVTLGLGVRGSKGIIYFSFES